MSQSLSCQIIEGIRFEVRLTEITKGRGHATTRRVYLVNGQKCSEASYYGDYDAARRIKDNREAIPAGR